MKSVPGILLFLSLPLLAGNAPYLVKDLPGSLEPRHSLKQESFWTTVGNTSWFVADECRGTGMQVWKTDGTSAGTVRLTDVLALTSAGHAKGEFLGMVNDKLIYMGGDLQGGALFALDQNGGTPVPLLRTDFFWPTGMAAGVTYKGALYFGAPAKEGPFDRGTELWRTDGTPGGTTFVELNPGKDGSVSRVFVLRDWMIFAGTTPAGSGLYRSDGTIAGTTLLKSTVVGEGIHYIDAVLNDRAFFTLRHQGATDELWITDGTLEGTRPVAGEFSDFKTLGVINDQLLFTTYQNGRTRIWKTDGTAQGTEEILDPPSGISLDNMIRGDVANGKYFFFLWDQTTPADDFVLYSIGAAPNTLTKVVGSLVLGSDLGVNRAWNGKFFFGALDEVHGKEWWSSDGTVAGTHLFVDAWPGEQSAFRSIFPLTRADGLLVGMVGPFGLEPWLLTEPADAKLLQNIGVDFASPGSSPRQLRAARDHLFFLADDAFDLVVGRSNGTRSGTTTALVHSIGAVSLHDPITSGDRYYVAVNASHGMPLISTDGTDEGSVIVAENVSAFTGFRDGVLFVESVNGTGFLRFSDGTASETRTIAWPEGPTLDDWTPYSANGKAWTLSDSHRTLAVSDGTAQLRRVQPLGVQINVAGGMVEGADATYFVNSNVSGFGASLFRTDGTNEGTRMVKSFVSHPGKLLTTATRLFFFVQGDLWTTDGTEAGTVVLPATGVGDACPGNMTALGSQLFWYSSQANGSKVLWKSDGTVEGTVQLLALPGPYDCASISAFDGKVYFSGLDAAHGLEPWVSDGTVTGTHLLSDIQPGMRSSEPMEFTTAAGHLFFTADSGNGRELWAVGPQERRRAAGHP